MKNFLVNMDDGSQRSIQVFNTVDEDGYLVLQELYFENLLTAVMGIKKEYLVLARVMYTCFLIYTNNDSDNSILCMELPRSASKYLKLKCPPYSTTAEITEPWGMNTPVIFTHLTELEYTFS
jgi:hypothetical protein